MILRYYLVRNKSYQLKAQILGVVQRYYSNEKQLNKKQNFEAHKPREIESKWYNLWQKKLKEFKSDTTRPVFSMILPPPNVTGTLHLGHAITATVQDIIVRWKLMNGYRTFWIPGVDHAGIATQVVVERKIWNERKLKRHDLGKDEFIKEVFEWKNSKTETIRNQTIKLNALLDWNNEYFTMDKRISKSVVEAFINLYEKGLILRSNRPINWCCTLKSAISDIEVDNLEVLKPTKVRVPNYNKSVEVGLIYSFEYPIQDSDEKITVATTRPETLFGDVAVAVNPNDQRYKHLHGKCALNPFTNELMPIILESNVDPNFGTGAVKVTPGHDFNDYEIGVRHNLKIKIILNEDGKLENVPDEFKDMHRFEARKKVLDKLKDLGLWKSSSPHKMVLPLCSRTGDILEPMIKDQWFIKVDDMFKACEAAAANGQMKLIPEWRINLWNQYTKAFRKDWCISRQLWWGHQIPAYKCYLDTNKKEYKWFVGRKIDEVRQKAVEYFKNDQIKIEQDPDVFDTWFSSGILPLAVFDWPDYTNPLKDMNESIDKLYPTNLLETGYDIMFFWVLRMAALCYALSGKFPFKSILFHGLVTDSQGRKMSKSIGNVIDPIDVIDGVTLDNLQTRIKNSNLDEKEKQLSIKNQETMFAQGIPECGSDALRLGLLKQDYKSDLLSIDINIFVTSQRFCNKLLQSTRFVEMYCADQQHKMRYMELNEILSSNKCNSIDLWIISQLVKTIKTVQTDFEDKYEFHKILNDLREFFYGNFCDFYLECSKPLMKQSQNSEYFERIELKWNILRHIINYTLLMYHPFIPSITEEMWQRRNTHKYKFFIKQSVDTVDLSEFFEEILHLTKSSGIQLTKTKLEKQRDLFEIEINKDYTVYVQFENPVNIELEVNRLNNKLKKCTNDKEKLIEKMGKENYLRRTTPENQEKDKQSLQEIEKKITSFTYQLKILATTS